MHSPMGIYYVASGRRPFFGVCGGGLTFTAFVINMYYLFVESWCALYALQYLGGLLAPLGLGFSLFPNQAPGLSLDSAAAYQDAFLATTGATRDRALFGANGASVLGVFALCAIANFWLIYRGVSKGIERFCKAVAPLILICSIIIIFRVLTLDNPTGKEGQSLLDGLGFMWNPQNAAETLKKPSVWLAATSQIFFSTSICTSAVLCYGSYVQAKRDVALSSLTSTMTNEFCEVCLGGLMIVPPAIMFLGAAASEKIGSVFSLGFVILPNVFGQMPAGQFFGFAFFALLFFAAITSSISQLQPASAFLEEAFGWTRGKRVLAVALAELTGTFVVCWFTEGLVALDAFDFWSANFMPFLCALVQTTLIVFFLGQKKLRDELDSGAIIKTSKYVFPAIAFVSLPYLAIVFGFWLYGEFVNKCKEFAAKPGSLTSEIFLLAVFAALVIVSIFTVLRWKREERLGKEKGANL